MVDAAAPDGSQNSGVRSVGEYQLCSFLCQVHTDDPVLAELIARFLAPFQATSGVGDAGRTYLVASDAPGSASLLADGEVVISAPPLDAVEYLLWELSQQAVASVTDNLALHAGCLSWRGFGIVIPAPSGAGKSTLTAGLTAAGCRYLSDEVAILDLDSGMLFPFPRALWMSRQSIDLIPGLLQRLPSAPGRPDRPERHVPPDCLREAPLGGPCPLRYVVVPEHVPGGETVLEPIRRSEALVSMVTNAFNFNQFKGPGLTALARIAGRVSAYRLRMADLSTAVDLVMEALDVLDDPWPARLP